MQVLSPGQPVSPNLPMPASASPANSPRQTVAVVVPYLPYITLAAYISALRPSSSAKNAPKIAQSWCNATPLESTLVKKRRSEEHTSELQSLTNLVCRLLLEKKKKNNTKTTKNTCKDTIRDSSQMNK